MADIEKQDAAIAPTADRRESDAHTLTASSPPGSDQGAGPADPEKGQKPGPATDTAADGGLPQAAKDADAEEEEERYRVTFDEDDPLNPVNFPRWKKWRILGVCCIAAFNVTCTSSMTTSAYAGIAREFGVGREVAILSLSLFVAGLGLGPSLLGPLSEFYGRRNVYLVSFGAFVLLGFPVAWANNIAVFLIFRFLTGLAGSAFLSVSGGTVSDMYVPQYLFLPMSIYTCSPFIGPVAGPLIAGFINQNTTWRWTFWVIIIWSAGTWMLLLLFAPETFAPIVLRAKARRFRQERKDGSDRWWTAHDRVVAGKSILQTVASNCTKVFKLLSLEPMLLATCTWSALLLGILYLCFEAFPIIFMDQHGFSLQETGLTFLGLGLGMVLGIMSMPYWAKKYGEAREKALKEGFKAAPPEARLPVGAAGAILTVIGLFWLAFTTYASVHWIVPIIASVPLGTGIALAYVGIFTHTVDTYRPVAASAMGANSVVRSCFAAAFPLFSEAMYHRLGTVGATALLGGLATLMIPIPFIFYKYGPQLRARGRFAAA